MFFREAPDASGEEVGNWILFGTSAWDKAQENMVAGWVDGGQMDGWIFEQ